MPNYTYLLVIGMHQLHIEAPDAGQYFNILWFYNMLLHGNIEISYLNIYRVYHLYVYNSYPIKLIAGNHLYY